ncbi:MAG: Polyphosphate kinase [Acidobacteriaceae bacterium]|nr:Polyphosphate kinase [Acidobacteriaceae bacterium]
MARTSLEDPSLFINREASWLAFNRRVLEEAEDPSNALLERVKFLAITASNLDEFFEVNVASLLQRIEDDNVEAGPDGLSPIEQRGLIDRETHDFVQRQYRCWNEQLLPTLEANGIRVRDLEQLEPAQKAFAREYFEREVDPLLTPVTVDPAHPFPRVINKALCLSFLLKKKRRASTYYMGVVTVPRTLPRLVKLPRTNGTEDYIFLADLIAFNAANLYRGYEVVATTAFRVTRNSNLYVAEEESRNLIESVRAELHNRRKGDAVRLEIEAGANQEIVANLRTNFELEPWQVFSTDGPVNLSRLFNFHELTERSDLKFKPSVPRDLALSSGSADLFEEIRKRDILLHHPFDSFEPVVRFLESSVDDPRVVSIKQTLYRTSAESPIAQALIEAAASTEVTVVVELKARFDEASNIRWARNMEDAGVQVFHGLVGLKTHCKLALLVRRDPDGVTRRYAHLGTGNYNSVTAKFYTDLSLLTADEQVTSAVHGVFNFLTAYAERPHYEPLLVAPLKLAEELLSLIARETAHAKQGLPARIVAKMNSLLDKSIIQELYRASQTGVQIDLVVRGMCALRPGIRGISDNIRVRSIVGRFLEHSRIFYFANCGNEEIYLSSADWMPRNLYERVEVAFPVKNEAIRDRIKAEILPAYLADNTKARILKPDGTYVRTESSRKRGRAVEAFNAQDFLICVAEGKKTRDDIPQVEPRRGVRSASGKKSRVAVTRA